MKAGDKIRPTVGAEGYIEREVLFVGDRYAVYRARGESGEWGEYSVTLDTMKRQFEAVPDFFEAGKTYSRFVKWSIRYQLRDIRESFHVERVVENRTSEGDTSPVAIGYYAPPSGVRRDWGFAQRYEWENEGWEEV